METNIIKIGNSRGVIIPAEMLRKMGIADKNTVMMEQSGDMLMIRPAPAAAAMTATRFYVCPACGNILHGTGEMQLSCHGHNLSPLEAQSPEGRFEVSVETVEDEYFVSVEHPMTKQDHISFMAAVSADRVQMVRLFPEGPAETRFKRSGVRAIYFYSAADGLFMVKPTAGIKR